MSLNSSLTVCSFFLDVFYMLVLIAFNNFSFFLFLLHVLLGGTVASWFNRVLDSGSSGPGSDPGWVHCVVFLGKTLYSHSASLHPGV